MPMVQITMLSGRIADALVEEAGARREALVVTFLKVLKGSYASAASR